MALLTIIDPDGTRHQLNAKPGSSVLQIARQNDIAIEGHVAARPVVLNQNPVWENSAGRANAMRQLMGDQGLDRDRIVRVTGHADREPAVRNPMARRNNRLEIVLLRDRL